MMLAKLNFDDPSCNVTPNIISRVGKNLHLRPNHPLNTIKTIIETYWKQSSSSFQIYDSLSPIVSTESNFDSLLIPPDHVSRSHSDTYYLNETTVLRTHTSAHQTELLKKGVDQFLVTGDVYRRDEIDSSHYPVFHQMEGVKLFTNDDDEYDNLKTEEDRVEYVVRDLKRGLEGMAHELFGDVEMRWIDAYFPFTDPSFELEIYYQDEWLEVLGCGVVQPSIISSSTNSSSLSIQKRKGWAFGLGLERLAMVLFKIPDIRLFWTEDARFHDQFSSSDQSKIVTFVPYSKYPACTKDLTFWLPPNTEEDEDEQRTTTRISFHVNDLNEIVRNVAGDWAEKVELIDEFVHSGTGRVSHCYRIWYRSMDRSLTNEEINVLQERVRVDVADKLGVELR